MDRSSRIQDRRGTTVSEAMLYRRILWSIVHRGIVAGRRLTAAHRTLPRIIIPGAQKAGTSSLAHYLGQHPKVAVPLKKEVHYFDGGLYPNVDNYTKGPNWYRMHFPIRGSGQCDDLLTYDASPLYMYSPWAPRRIKSLLPTAKFVFLLRDPVERAISHYYHARRTGKETLDIQTAFEKEEGRLSKALAEENYKDYGFINYGYLARGIYHVQIRRFMQYFPRDQMLFVQSERLFSDTKESMEAILLFLNLPNCVNDMKLSAQNVNPLHKEVPGSLISELTGYFYEHNRRLFSLLGERFDWLGLAE